MILTPQLHYRQKGNIWVDTFSFKDQTFYVADFFLVFLWSSIQKDIRQTFCALTFLFCLRIYFLVSFRSSGSSFKDMKDEFPVLYTQKLQCFLYMIRPNTNLLRFDKKVWVLYNLTYYKFNSTYCNIKTLCWGRQIFSKKLFLRSKFSHFSLIQKHTIKKLLFH